MQIAIFIACFCIIGLLIVVCLELKDISSYIRYMRYALEIDVDGAIRGVLDELPNTFEYNGTKGKVYHK